MRSAAWTLAAAALIAMPAAVAAAETDPVARGAAVAREADRRDRGFHDSRATLEMIIENRAGQSSRRRMRIDTLESPSTDDGDKTLVIFDEPRDVKGTALLSYAHILEPDDQWLYLPALNRVKRISSKNKSGPFVGSEFAYEDMVAQELEKYDYRWLRDEPCGEWTCSVIEQRPRYEDSGYTRLVAWYDTAEYRLQRIDYHDRKDDVLKTLTLGDYRRHLDRYWRAHDLFMVNHQSGKKTRVLLESIEFGNGLSESDFTRARLERAR